jgi:hypothetical protein
MTRKKSAGLYIACVSIIAALVSLIAYMMNTKTNYYAKMGVDMGVVLCLVAGIALIVGRVVMGMKNETIVTDALTVCASVLLTVGLVMLLNARVNNLAAVFTFENSAANMADTTSCIIAIAAALIAMIISIISSFFDITKEA